jgi:hypothetical protein
MRPYRITGILFAIIASWLSGLPGVIGAADWVPTPLVIDAKDTEYAFDGSTLYLHFDLSGKPAKIWMVIESRLSDNQEPVAVRNGFKGWHYVNKIDTTIYVSTSESYEPGTNCVFPWNGRSNETANGTPNKTDGGLVPPGTYTYYLWGYDYLSISETACDFMSIGNYWEGQYVRLYTAGEDGLPLVKPLLMGMLPPANCPYGTEIRPGTMFKWAIGNDPYDQSLLQTSLCKGFGAKDIDTYVSKRAVGEEHIPDYGAGLYLPDDFETFVFPKVNTWQNLQTVVKYTFVENGLAQQDTTWGDFGKIGWYYPGSSPWEIIHPVLETDGAHLYEINGGRNSMEYKYDRLRIMSVDDPTDILWDRCLDEFYMPGQPDGLNSSGLSQFVPSNIRGRYFVTGTATCLQECIDVGRILGTATPSPYAADGSGYVVWANSNGDFFMDMAYNPDMLGTPGQLWACIVTEPRNSTTPREHFAPADRNGFLVSYSAYTGIYDFGVYCPDGTGFGLGQFDDKINPTQWKTGTICDTGGIYDGLFMTTAVDDLSSDVDTSECNRIKWIAFDSDKALIAQGIWCKCISRVGDNTPSVFNVAQNAPNPFNPTTTISFTIARNTRVSVDVFNVAGQKVAALADEFMTAGGHSVVWDASGFATGIYFATVRAGECAKTIKMTLVK